MCSLSVGIALGGRAESPALESGGVASAGVRGEVATGSSELLGSTDRRAGFLRICHGGQGAQGSPVARKSMSCRNLHLWVVQHNSGDAKG